MPLTRLLSIMMLSFFITACGGGGSLEKEGSIGDGNGGTTPDVPTYAVTLQGYSQEDGSASNTVTAASALDLRAKLVKDGVPVSGARITFTLSDDVGILNPNSGSALTKDDGVAKIELTAGTVKGAGAVTASYTVDGETYTSQFDFESAGDADINDPSLFSLALEGYSKSDGSKSNRVSASSVIELKAKLEKDGSAVTGARVTFTLADEVGVLNPSSGSALTKDDGIATLDLTAGTVKGAGVVTASYTVNGATYSSQFSFESAGDADGSGSNLFTLSLEGFSKSDGSKSNRVSANSAIELKAKLEKDGSSVNGARVIFTLADEVGVLNPSSGSALTKGDGIATLDLTAGTVKGAGVVTASYTVDGETYTSQFAFESAGDAGGNDTSLFILSLEGFSQADGSRSNTVSAGSPLNLHATLTKEGIAVTGERITFTLADSIGKLNPTSGTAITDNTGIAKIELGAGEEAGAGGVTASYTINGVTYSDTFSFQSTGGQEAYQLLLKGYSKLDGSESNSVTAEQPLDLHAILTKEGKAVTGERVVFSLVDDIGKLNPTSGTAITDNTGIAVIKLTAGEKAGAGEVTASYTINGVSYKDTFSFQSSGDQVAYTLSIQGYSKETGAQSNTVTSLEALDLKATVLDDIGAPVTGKSVTFALDGNIGALNPESGSVLTDNSGVAQIELTSGNVAGASSVVVRYINQGQTYSSEPFDFEAVIVEKAQLTVNLIASDGTETRMVDFEHPAVAQAKLLVDGQPSAYQLIQFDLSGFGKINPSNGTAMTDAEGIAKVDLLTGIEAGAGIISATYKLDENTAFDSNSFTYTSKGDAPPPGTSNDFTIDLSLLSSTRRTQISEISAADSGLVVATILDVNGMPAVGKVVTFSSTLGSLLPSSGTALTDAEGIAKLNLTSGTVEGAGIVTAQFEAVEAKLGFYTRGDAIDPNQSSADISFSILKNCPSDFKTIRNVSSCEETASISGDSAGILYIQVNKKDSTTALAQTLVTATTTIGSISPSTGTAITDENGIALLDIIPGRDVGAGEITVSVLNSSLTKAFQIAAVDIDIAISSSVASGQSLTAGSTALVSVEITKDGSLYTAPLNVEFSSGCVDSALAVIDEKVTSIGGFARSTYRPLTCVGGDIITASVITGGDTVSANTTINVSPANIGFIQFVEVTKPVISLKGTGGANRSEISEVVFKLVDANGNDLASRTVDFTLSTAVGGITLGADSAITNALGEIRTTVQSGVVATPVRVIASIEEDIDGDTVTVSAPSDVLVISTGIADQNSFSLSRSIFNVHGLNVDGSEVTVNARLADHFNNPVPDGTAVSFITEGGVIEPSCTTSNGACSVTWRSSNPRPFTNAMYENTIAQKCDRGLPCPLGILNNDYSVDLPLGGRATVLAYAIGEETFSDLNGNGYFDSQDFFSELFDIPEAFIDNNEDGTYGGKDCNAPAEHCSANNSKGDEFEEFIDFDNDGQWTTGNSMYNGLLCRPEDVAINLCSRDLVNVFQNQEIVMSGDAAFFRVVTFANDCAAIPGVTASEVHVNSDPASPVIRRVPNDLTSAKMCQISQIDLTEATGVTSAGATVYIADIYNNPLPAETTVKITSEEGKLSGTTDYVFPNTTSIRPINLSFGISRVSVEDKNSVVSGNLTITATATSGLITSTSITILHDKKL
ncbi:MULTISPECIES: Ig domain-containing protein [unclassified Pseudoalteromonas]|uniref:beta strand repeat-containing protein n=1 Tax=unclassified Pseudoalteromonas TaxID=194690 RepID=UPI00332E0CF0